MTVGRLSVIDVFHKVDSRGVRRQLAYCYCSCGQFHTLRYEALLKKNPTASCGCLNKEQITRVGKASKKAAISGQYDVFTQYRYNATVRKHSFELTLAEFASIAVQVCTYCGSLPELKRADWLYNGLDRVDSAKGYTSDNVVPCCARCNLMKNKFSVPEFLAQVEKINQWRIVQS